MTFVGFMQQQALQQQQQPQPQPQPQIMETKPVTPPPLSPAKTDDIPAKISPLIPVDSIPSPQNLKKEIAKPSGKITAPY